MSETKRLRATAKNGAVPLELNSVEKDILADLNTQQQMLNVRMMDFSRLVEAAHGLGRGALGASHDIRDGCIVPVGEDQ